MKYHFYVCILGFFVHGFPKLLRFQEHHEKILNKFLSKLKQHLVGRRDIDLHSPTTKSKDRRIECSLCSQLPCPFHLLCSCNCRLIKEHWICEI